MAKRRGRKSDAIRAVLAEKPGASVKEIQAALAAKRVKASTALIHQVKGRKKRGRAHINGRANGVTLEHLLAAKRLVASVGSIDAARSAIDGLAKLI